ncbi:MAG: YcfL family protein [Vibrionaceae bacterium]
MHILKKIGLSCTLAVIVALTSCASTEPRISINQTQKIIFANSELEQTIVVDDLRLSEKAEGLFLGFAIKNNSSQQQDLQYRLDWYDEQGLEINVKKIGWQALSLGANEQKRLAEFASSAKAKDFRISIRSLKK